MINTTVKYLLFSVSLFIFSSGAGYCAELREVIYAYPNKGAQWEVSAAHVICDACSPTEKLSYMPANYVEKILRVKANNDDSSCEGCNAVEIMNDAGQVARAEDSFFPEKCRPDKSDEPSRNESPAACEFAEPQPEKAVTVFFDFNRHDIEIGELEKLESIITLMKLGDTIRVYGYTCDVGEKEYNDALALKRAEAVYFALTKRGVDSKRITLAGFGVSVVGCAQTQAGYACAIKDRIKNRRAEIYLFPSML